MTEDPRSRLFVISDIHGDLAGLETVLMDMYQDGMDLTRDRLVQLGDMIDGYAHSKEVVGLLRGMQEEYGRDHVIVLLGNHEDMLMRSVGKNDQKSDFVNWWYQGGANTFYSYEGDHSDETLPFMYTYADKDVESFIPQGQMKDDISWFATLPLYYETDDHIFVHAGLKEPLPPEGNKRWDMLWIREPFHDSTYDWGKTVVYGHTAREYPLVEPNKMGLDTRWRGHGYVSGAEVMSRERYRFFDSR